MSFDFFAALERKYRAWFRHDVWNIGLVRQPIAAFLDPNANYEIEWLSEPPDGAFLADPFGLVVDQTLQVFCERFDYPIAKGTICTFSWPTSQEASFESVIEQPFHLSYPYLISHNDKLYGVLEQAQSRRVDLYQAKQNMSDWHRVATIIDDFPAVDSTIFKHQGHWWLICASSDEGAFSSKLYVWYAADLFGPWTAHSGNPVKTDIRSTRPAGTPFVHQGELYRPAQDCSADYGAQMVINRIIRLTPTEFKEEIVIFIAPNQHGPYPDGIHTLSAVGENITLVDGKRIEFRWDALLGRIRRRLLRR